MALFLIIGLTIMGLLISGCEKMKQAEAPKQEAAPAPQAVQEPSSQTPAQPPAQLGKGSTDSAAQTAIPTEAKLNMQQGMNYLKSHDYENAIKEFTVAIQKHAAYDVAYSNRAVAYMQQKKFNKAMDDLKKAEEINPNNSTVHYNFMALYSLQNQLDRALDSLDRALELGFNNYDALRTDPDLVNVRKHPEFRKILEKHKVFIYK
jgi:tetratricopeptide (TPR) repeat protein